MKRRGRKSKITKSKRKKRPTKPDSLTEAFSEALRQPDCEPMTDDLAKMIDEGWRKLAEPPEPMTDAQVKIVEEALRQQGEPSEEMTDAEAERIIGEARQLIDEAPL